MSKQSHVLAATTYAKGRVKVLENEDLEAPLGAKERRMLIALLMNAYLAGIEARSR